MAVISIITITVSGRCSTKRRRGGRRYEHKTKSGRKGNAVVSSAHQESNVSAFKVRNRILSYDIVKKACVSEISFTRHSKIYYIFVSFIYLSTFFR